MKRLLVFVFAVTLLGSCTKEPQDCHCGTIINDGIDNGCYWLEIESQCSGNSQTFCFDQSVWMNNYVGDQFCVEGVPDW